MIGALIIFALGLGMAALCATVGVAAASVTQLELTRWVQVRLRGTTAASSLRDNPGRVVTAASALSTMGVVVAATALPWVIDVGGPVTSGGSAIAIAVPGFLAAVWLLPRVAGRRWAGVLVARAVPWVDHAAQVLAPILPDRPRSTHTALAAMFSGADPHALTNTGEMAIVSGVLAFTDRPVRDLMTPRTAVVAIPEGMPAGEAAHVFAQSGYSRYPVYRQSLDDVIGVVYAFDLLHRQPEAPVPVRPVLQVPETSLAADVLKEMKRGRGHLAVALDEFGGTAGVVTFDDLLRSLLHEIFDDEPAHDTEDSPGFLECTGNTPLDEVAATFHVMLGSREVQTVGGLLVQSLGRIPRAGERFLLSGLEFDVLAAGATRVERVAVRRVPVRAVPLGGGGG